MAEYMNKKIGRLIVKKIEEKNESLFVNQIV